jgi:hypothetical protein
MAFFIIIYYSLYIIFYKLAEQCSALRTTELCSVLPNWSEWSSNFLAGKCFAFLAGTEFRPPSF